MYVAARYSPLGENLSEDTVGAELLDAFGEIPVGALGYVVVPSMKLLLAPFVPSFATILNPAGATVDVIVGLFEANTPVPPVETAPSHGFAVVVGLHIANILYLLL